MKWFKKSLDIPEWEYEAQNADALSVIQPWGEINTRSALCVEWPADYYAV